MQSIPTNSGGYPYVILSRAKLSTSPIGNDANPNDVLSRMHMGSF